MLFSVNVWLTFTDPLEQFLTVNLFPGCPVNNWDSSWLVVLIAVGLTAYLFLIDQLTYEGFFKNVRPSLKLSYVDKKINFSLGVLLNQQAKGISLSNKVDKNHTSIEIKNKFIDTFINFSNLVHSSIGHLNVFVLFLDNITKFITSIIKENLFIKKYSFFTLYYFSFLIILFFNLLGLLPNSVTATSSFIFILNYSFSILVGLNCLGYYIHGSKYFSQYLPEGVPLFIAPVLALIELFSNIIRIFSLTVRLFANILAGHSLLKIIISVSWILISVFLFYVPISVVVWLLLTPIFLLECVIAFLQAYVYVLLLIIYTNDVINVH